MTDDMHKELIRLRGIIGSLDKNESVEVSDEDIKKITSQVGFRNERGDYFGAINFGNKLLKKKLSDDDKAYILIELGEAYYETKQYDVSITTYLEAEKLTNDKKTLYFSVYLWLARAYRDKGDFDKAEEYFKKVHDYSPGSYHDIEYMGVLKKQGKIRELKEFYEQNKDNPRFFKDMADKILSDIKENEE